jgi:hypothetical protein
MLVAGVVDSPENAFENCIYMLKMLVQIEQGVEFLIAEMRADGLSLLLTVTVLHKLVVDGPGI